MKKQKFISLVCTAAMIATQAVAFANTAPVYSSPAVSQVLNLGYGDIFGGTGGEVGDTDLVYTDLDQILTLKYADIFGGAVDEPTYYTITVDDSIVGGKVEVDKTEAEEGEVITITATPDVDYELVEITVNGEAIDGNTYTITTENIEVSAVFAEIIPEPTDTELVYDIPEVAQVLTLKYSDIFTGSGEVTPTLYNVTVANDIVNGTVTVDKTTAAAGVSVTVTATPATGYELEKVYVNNDSISELTFTMPAEDVEVKATFKKKIYEISKDDNVTITEGTGVYGETVKFTVKEAELGYEVIVKVDGEVVTPDSGVYSFVVGAADAVIAVEYKAIEYTIAENVAGEGTYEVTGTPTIGQTITITAAPASGHRVASVEVSGDIEVTSNGNIYTFVMPAGNVEITVTFEAIPPETYEVTVTASEGGTASVDKTTAEAGETITVTATPELGYELGVIRVNGQIIDGNTFEMPATAAEVEVDFVKTVYDLIADGDVVIELADTYYYGDVITFTVPDKTGYTKVVKVNDEAVDADGEGVYTHTVVADVDITVEYTAIDYTIEAPEVANVTVVAPETANYEDEVVLTVTPAEGYKVTSVKYNETTIEYNNGYKFVMPAEDVTITVTVEEIPADAQDYEITLPEEVENGTVEAEGVETAKAGEVVTITATPAEGYKAIVKYNDTEIEANGVDNTYSFIMPDEAVEITVEFVPEVVETEFTIEIDQESNGTTKVKVNGGEELKNDIVAKEGDEIQIVADPKNNYEVKKVTVKCDGEAVEFEKVRTNKYEFIMPAGDVEVKVTYKSKNTTSGGSSGSGAIAGMLPTVPQTVTGLNGATITVDGSNSTVVQSGSILESTVNGNKLSVYYPLNDGNDYVIVAADDTVIAKTVLDEATDTLSAYVPGNGKYTIKLVDGLVFSDVTPGTWFKKAVDFVSARGVMNGVGGDTFDPNGTVTRAMVVATLQRIEDKGYANTNTPFADVDPSAWYAKSVAWAYEKGIVNGVSATAFDPNAPVTREQLAKIIDNYLRVYAGIGSSADLSAFVDSASISDWATAHVSSVVGSGIITGTDKGEINPLGNATRAEYATMLMRSIEVICK